MRPGLEYVPIGTHFTPPTRSPHPSTPATSQPATRQLPAPHHSNPQHSTHCFRNQSPPETCGIPQKGLGAKWKSRCDFAAILLRFYCDSEWRVEGGGRRDEGWRKRDEALKCDKIRYDSKREVLKFDEVRCDYRRDGLNIDELTYNYRWEGDEYCWTSNRKGCNLCQVTETKTITLNLWNRL